MGFNFDGRSAADVVIGAVGADRWEAEIFGRASHAGGAPERGISATMILAEALAAVRAGGWFGKVVKDGRKGTSNVGPFGGVNGGPAGDATNVVTDYVLVRGESRSHDAKFFREITDGLQGGVQPGRRRGDQQRGQGRPREVHHPHRLSSLPAEGDRTRGEAGGGGGRGAGPRRRTCASTNGGLDANWMVRHGIPTVTFGAGQNETHTVDEWINLAEFEFGLPPRCRARDERVERGFSAGVRMRDAQCVQAPLRPKRKLSA